MIEKLEGLSAKDRQLWEQKYQDRLTGKTPEEIERLWRDSRFVKKFRGTPEYKWMSTLSEDERDELYNKDYINKTNASNALNTPMTVDMGGEAMLAGQKPSPKNFSIESPAVSSPNPATKKLALETLDVLNFTKDPATQKAIDDYQTAEQQYVKANPEYLSSEWYKRQAVKLAEEKSPAYRKYKNFEWFNMSDADWGKALKKYEVDKTIYGEEEATEKLNNDIMKIASEQEPYYRKAGLAFLGMGALVLGGTSVIGGMLLLTPAAIYAAADNIINDDKGIRFDQAFIDNLLSNPAVEYGAKVILYGTLNTDRMKYIDEELGGLSDMGFAKDPEAGIFTNNLLFEIGQQHGFTILSMGTSAAASATVNFAVKGASKIAANKLTRKFAGDMLKKKLAASAIKYNTLNSVLQATTVPFFVASTEAGLNGYQTKEQIFDELNSANLQAYNEKVMSDVAEQELMLNLSRGATEGQSFVSDYERQMLQERAKRKYLPEYMQGEAHANALAILAMSSLFYTTSFVNGAANATLLRALQAPRVQSALNNSKLFSKVSNFMKPKTTASGAIGNATVKTVTPTWLKVGAVLKQPAGEYLEEYLPAVEGMATADAKRYNMTEFLDKSYNSDIELEVGQAMEGLFKVFMRGVGAALVSEEANTQGAYGALSSIVGGPMIRMGDYRTSTVDREGNMKSKFSLARREGEGRLEHVTRIMPWQGGVAMEVRSQVNLARAAKKEAELLLLSLNDPELAARLQQVKTSMAWGKDMGDAAEAGDEFAYRNSEQGRSIQDAILLNKIKDTDLGKAHISTMKRQAQMEMNSPDAAQYIKEVKANPDNLSEGMTDELIVEQGKKNAKKYLENLEFVSKETEVLNKQLGNVSDDVLSTLIYGRSQLQNWEKRAESLDKEITEVNILKPTVSSPVNADLTNVLKLFGSHKNMMAKKAALEKGIQARELSLKDYIKTHKKLTKPQLQAIDKYRLEIKARKEELKAINALEKTVEGESLMNEHDILRAPADLRAHMLNPENKNLFTAAQLKVIEKVVLQGLAHSPEFLTKVQDAGKISAALGLYYSQYTKFLNNPGYLISYAERARLNKENAVFESNAQKIANIDNYEMFASELDDIFNNPKNSKAVITKATLDKITKDDPNHFYHKYKKDRTEFMGVLNSAIRSGNNEELSEDDVAMLANAVKFLQANNIDLKDSSKIVEVMTAVDANGVNIFKDFMENQPKTSLLATKEGTYTTPEDVITKLKFVLDKYNKELEDLKSKNPEIVVTDTPASANITPVVPIVDVPKAPNNVTPGSNTEENETTEDDTPQTPAEVSAAAKETLRNGIKRVENTVKAASTLYSKNAKDRVMKDFSKITLILQDSPSATLEMLMSLITDLQTKYALLATKASDSDENAMYNEAGMLAQIIFNNLQALNSEQQNSIFDKLYYDYESVDRVQSPDAASIEILNIAYLKRRFSSVGTPILTYLNIYKVEEFLARNFKKFDPNGKTKIKFMYDPKLAKDVQSSMENAGKEYDLNAVPIVAVTLVSKKTPTSIEIEEGGKTVYYQPIGILPSTTNPYAQGANRTKYLREQLPAKFEKLTNPTLLVDEEGNTISTTFSSKIHAKSPEKTNDRNIADVIVGQLNNTPENEKLKSLNKKDRLKSPLYKGIRDAFIKRFVTVKPHDSSTRLAFTQSNLNFGDENDVKHLFVIVNNGGDITKIEERNSDTKLVDLFLQENVNKEDAINSNSRVEKFAFKLKLFVQKDFSKHTISVTVNSETGEVSATDSAAEIKKLEESLTNSLNHVIFAKGSWTYTITPTNLVDANNNRLFNLSLTNQEGKDITIPLGQISKSALSIDSQFEILQNIFKAANSQQAEFKFQVDYSDANIANSETANPEQKKIAFKNMQEMFDDGLFYINQTSTEFQITGFTMHSPYDKDGKLLKTNEVVTAPTITDKTIVSPNGEKVDSETMVADAKTIPTETKDAEVNKLLLEQQKHSILFKLSDDGKYYINTKTGELFINLDYNEQDVSNQEEKSKAIEQLFNENPELANQIYEALGFTGNISDEQKQQQIAGIEKRRLEKLLGETFTKTTEKIVTSKGQSNGKTIIRKVKSKISSDGEVLTITPTAEFKEGGGVVTTPETMTLKEFKEQFYEKMSEEDKEFFDEIFEGVEDTERIKLKEARIGLKGVSKGQVNIDVETLEGQPFGFRINNGKEINAKYDAELAELDKQTTSQQKQEQITPEQKQEAVQAYSQYLNTIGVTDIGYHHSESDLESFTTFSEGYFQKELKKKGTHYKEADDIVFFVRKPLTEEFMSKRKFTGTWGLKIPNTLQFNAGEKVGEGVHPGIDEGIKNAVDGNYDAVDFGRIRDNKTWSEVIAITNPKNAVKLGSKQDIQGFKEFVNKISFDKELAQKIQNKLQELYPEIKLNITNNPIWEQGDNIFNQEEYNNQVNYRLKLVEALLNLSTSQEGKRFRKYGEVSRPVRLTFRLNTKERPNLETNIRKQLRGKGVTNNQIDFIFDYMKSNNIKEISTEDLITQILFSYSYTFEINTAKEKLQSPSDIYNFNIDGDNYSMSYYQGVEDDYTSYFKNNEEISYEEYNKAQDKYLEVFKEKMPTQHYSNLTVPGGTNYRENAIRIPGVVNVISANGGYHDNDFNQSRGDMAGWFRSDDKQGQSFVANNQEEVDVYEELGYSKVIGTSKPKYIKKSKTRRILEIQSFFQKVRDRSDLVHLNEAGRELQEEDSYEIRRDGGRSIYVAQAAANYYAIETFAGDGYDTEIVPFSSFPQDVKDEINQLRENKKKEANKITGLENSKENKFLQLLNKNDNWVTFFIKSIIQDSAKTGYEKVLFPKGATAAKIEGHEVLAEEINRINNSLEALYENNVVETGRIGYPGSYQIRDKNNYIVVGEINKDKVEQLRQSKISELEQRKQELKSQGIEKLRPIEAFYEIKVGNILEKLFGKDNIKTITDEYGNQWREITINQARDLQDILLQRNEANQIIGQANIKAMTVLVDAINQKQDTLPHEYAHHYIAWFRDTPIVQEAIKKWGSEEALVQSIGEQVVAQKGEALNWWNKFAKWIMDQFNSLSKLEKQELTQLLTDAFLTRRDLNSDQTLKTKTDSKGLLLSLKMLGLNNLKKNFKITGQVLEGKNSFKVLSKADYIATTPEGKIVLILDGTKNADNIEEKLNMQKELLEQNKKFKVASLYKVDVNGKLTEVPILNSKEMAELNKNKIKQLNKSELTNIEEEKSPSIVTKPVTVEDNLLLKANEDKLKILSRIEELKQELDKKIQEIKNKPVLETTNTTDTKNMEVVGYANSIYDNKLSNITSTPQENETTFVIKKGKNGILYLDVYEGAHKRILANPSFVDGTEKQVLNNATQVSVNLLGEVSKNLTTGEYIINKKAKVSIDSGESLKSTNAENNSLNLIDAIKEEYKTKIESEKSKLKQLEKAEAPTTKKEANTNNSTETLEDMAAGLDMFSDLGIAEDLGNTPTSSISEFAWNNLKNLVLESGETVNEAEVKKMLAEQGITELVWNNMTDQMRENTLRCKGFL